MDIDFLFASIIHDRSHPAIIAELERLEGTFDPDRQWVQADGYRLSDRVWDAGQETRRNIDRVLRQALATGEDALVTADKLETYLNPSLRPKRTKMGRLRRNQPRSVVTATPGRGGQGSYAARRLTRTEMTRAHAEATRIAGTLNRWVTGLKYNLSPSHPRADICDPLAAHDEGNGRGVYTTGGCPLPPRHPHCLCFVTQVVTDDINSVVDTLRVEYGLNSEPTGDPFPFEDASLRSRLPSDLQHIWSVPTDLVIVPTNIRDKILESHTVDAGVITRIHELLATWQLTGPSPKGTDRFEVYAQMDGVWLTAVVVFDDEIAANILVTLHRILERKVLSRERRGYLTRRSGA